MWVRVINCYLSKVYGNHLAVFIIGQLGGFTILIENNYRWAEYVLAVFPKLLETLIGKMQRYKIE
jgi:hypothetical protein